MSAEGLPAEPAGGYNPVLKIPMATGNPSPLSVCSVLFPYFRGFTSAIGWLVFALLLFSLVNDWNKSLKSPLPHQYGEGIMVWMTREISEGRSPYGDILGTPSRYSCYGPLAPTISAAVSKVIPDSPMRYVYAGRFASYAAWLIAGLLLGYACAEGMLPRAAGMVLLPALVVGNNFFWTFRVDSFVLAAEAALLAVLVRAPPRVLKYALPIAVTALTLTKPPAAADILPLLLIALALRRDPPQESLKILWKPLAVALATAPAVFFGLDLFLGGWMSNNILWVQLGSGNTSGDGLSHNINVVWYNPAMLAVLLWAAFAVASRRDPRGRWLLAAFSTSLVLCATFALKHGADINYFFPGVMVALTLALSQLRVNRFQVALLLAGVAWVVLPLDTAPAHRQGGSSLDSQRLRSEHITKLHSAAGVLTEDPFFSVLASRQPMATDLFQISAVAAHNGKAMSTLVKSSSSAWGGSRLNEMLARYRPFGPAENATPMGFGYVWDAVWIPSIAAYAPTYPPQGPNRPPPLREYVRRIVIPAAFLFVLALTPYPPRSRRQDRRQ